MFKFLRLFVNFFPQVVNAAPRLQQPHQTGMRMNFLINSPSKVKSFVMQQPRLNLNGQHSMYNPAQKTILLRRLEPKPQGEMIASHVATSQTPQNVNWSSFRPYNTNQIRYVATLQHQQQRTFHNLIPSTGVPRFPAHFNANHVSITPVYNTAPPPHLQNVLTQQMSSTMISPPIEPNTSILLKPFELPTITSVQSCFPMSSYLNDDRSLETPAPMPIECVLKCDTPSPSLPPSPRVSSPTIDAMEFLMMSLDDGSVENHHKRKNSCDDQFPAAKRYRRTKAQIISDRNEKLESELKQCSVSMNRTEIKEPKSTVRVFSGSTEILIKENLPRVPRMKFLPLKFIKVCRIGFMKTQHGTIFSCQSDCKFKSYQSTKFRDHLMVSHDSGPMDQMNIAKFCQICKMNLNGWSHVSELNHMLSAHVLSCSSVKEILYSSIRSRSDSDSDSDFYEEEDEEIVQNISKVIARAEEETNRAIAQALEQDVLDELELETDFDVTPDSNDPDFDPEKEFESEDEPVLDAAITSAEESTEDSRSIKNKSSGDDHSSKSGRSPKDCQESEDNKKSRKKRGRKKKTAEVAQWENFLKAKREKKSSQERAEETSFEDTAEPVVAPSQLDALIQVSTSLTENSIETSKTRITCIDDVSFSDAPSNVIVKEKKTESALTSHETNEKSSEDDLSGDFFGKIPDEVVEKIKKMNSSRDITEEADVDESECCTQASPINDTEASKTDLDFERSLRAPEVQPELIEKHNLKKCVINLTDCEKRLKLKLRIRNAMNADLATVEEIMPLEKNARSSVLQTTESAESTIVHLRQEVEKNENDTFSIERMQVSDELKVNADENTSVGKVDDAAFCSRNLINEKNLSDGNDSASNCAKKINSNDSLDMNHDSHELQENFQISGISEELQNLPIPLSAVSSEISTDVVKIIPSPDDIKVFQKDFEEIGTIEMPLSSPDTWESLLELYPWIDDDKVEKWSKSSAAIQSLRSENSLYSTFKCMSIECTFYTTDLSTFESHLEVHRNKDKFFLCSFCLFHDKEPEELIKHLNDLHKFDRYQCDKCMYRSCESVYCYLHKTKFHPNEDSTNKVTVLRSPVQNVKKIDRGKVETELKATVNDRLLKCSCKF